MPVYMNYWYNRHLEECQPLFTRFMPSGVRKCGYSHLLAGTSSRLCNLKKSVNSTNRLIYG